MPRLYVFLLSLCCAVATDTAMANGAIQSHESIRSAVRGHIESNFRHSGEAHDVEVAPLDQRLQLPLCDQPLVVASMPGSRDIGNVSVAVRCQGSQPWSIYSRAYVRLYKPVAVLKTSVRQGTILSAGDVELVGKDAASLHGGFLGSEDVIGKPVKKTLSAGTVLLPVHLDILKLVKRGQQIAIRAQNPSFQVSMTGIALMDGEAGQRIRARNAVSQRIVEGQVTADGAISVSP